jgi:hypothetical protein
MGILKKAKETAAANEARVALEAGQAIFVWTGGSSFTGGNKGLGSLDEQIEAIEAEGWHLEHFSTAWSTSGANHLVASCIFRRV